MKLYNINFKTAVFSFLHNIWYNSVPFLKKKVQKQNRSKWYKSNRQSEPQCLQLKDTRKIIAMH